MPQERSVSVMHTRSRKLSQAGIDGPPFVYHPSFEAADAAFVYRGLAPDDDGAPLDFMPDEVTRDLARRMHYAGWRARQPATRRDATRLRRNYYDLRNRIVVGNHKLIYKAVRKWLSADRHGDDLAGECQIVLIKAVAAFNPWLGIRFSTYAFTCLMRALSRLNERWTSDRLSHSLSLACLSSGGPSCRPSEELVDPRLNRLGDFLREESTLLTSREKLVLSRRFHLSDETQETETLEQVGRDLGLSKERVRQVQKAALLKLREALLATGPPA